MKTAVGIALILILAAASSLVMVKTASASIPKPSVPEFTIKYIASGFDIAPTYRIDPYNGTKVVDQPGYHIDNSSIVITIKNQPFNEHYNGLNYHLFYDVKHKGHFSTDEWKNSNYGNFTYETINPKNNYNPPQVYEQQKDSEYTTVYVSASNYPANTQLDFRVEADLYYEGQFRVYYDWLDFTGFMINGYIIDQDSGWSSTQTINLDAAQPTINPTEAPSPTTQVLPTQTPTEAADQPNTQTNVAIGVDWKDLALTAAFIVIVVLAVALVLLWRNRA